MLTADVIDVLRQGNGTRNKSRSRRAGRGGDRLTGKNEKLLYCRVNSAIPHFRVDRALHRRQRARYRSVKNHHHIQYVVDHSLFRVSSVALVFHRGDEATDGARRGGHLLVPERLAADFLLGQAALTQMAAAVDGETAASHEATGQQIID